MPRSRSIPGVRLYAGDTPFVRYLKVSEGCDHGCAFCAIPLMRGKHRSFALDDIVKEAQLLELQGAREVNLVAQDLAHYGRDLRDRPERLPELLEALLRETSIPWFRKLYLYCAGITPALLEVIAREPRIMRYLDIPMQHASRCGARADATPRTAAVDPREGRAFPRCRFRASRSARRSSSASRARPTPTSSSCSSSSARWSSSAWASSPTRRRRGRRRRHARRRARGRQARAARTGAGAAAPHHRGTVRVAHRAGACGAGGRAARPTETRSRRPALAGRRHRWRDACRHRRRTREPDRGRGRPRWWTTTTSRRGRSGWWTAPPRVPPRDASRSVDPCRWPRRRWGASAGEPTRALGRRGRCPGRPRRARPGPRGRIAGRSVTAVPVAASSGEVR